MPTKREREYYRMGFVDAYKMLTGVGPVALQKTAVQYAGMAEDPTDIGRMVGVRKPRTAKRKLSAWNKYVKANSKKPRFRYRNGKLNLKKMAVAFRKTPAGRKKRR